VKEDESFKGQEKYCRIYTPTLQKLCQVATHLSIEKRNIKSVENDTMLESEPDLHLTDVERPPQYYSF